MSDTHSLNAHPELSTTRKKRRVQIVKSEIDSDFSKSVSAADGKREKKKGSSREICSSSESIDVNPDP